MENRKEDGILGADRFRFENLEDESMSGADLDNRYQSMSNNKRQD